MAGSTNDLDGINIYSQDGDYSRQSLYYYYRLSRPMPQGKRVYLTLLQFILLNIVQATSEIFFRVVLIKYFEGTGTTSAPISILFKSVPLLLCLPMGFIADRYFGRAKVLYYSWILLFIAQIFITYYFIIEALGNIPHHLIYITFVGAFVNSIGLAGIRVNLIPFGVDQMKAASSDQLSSYFYWYYWCRNVGQFLAYSICGSLIVSTSYLTALFVSSTAAAAGLITNILCYNLFIKTEKISNPLLLVYRVLKYAATVKRPVERTAFSYDGRPEPSRIDLAMVTHLGNFRDEEVEDVKTFLRIVMFLISLTGFLCVHSLLSNVYIVQSAYFQQGPFVSHTYEYLKNCPGNRNYTVHHQELIKPFSLYWIVLLNIATVLLFIILLDRVVFPFCFTWIPSMLNRIGIGMCIGLITIICALTTEVIRYERFMTAKSNNIIWVNVFPFFEVFAVDTPVGIMTPQFIIQAVAECLVLITMVEFIYAQSPAYMKGLLLGSLFFIEGCAMTLGSLLFLSQSGRKTVFWEYFRIMSKTENLSCDVYTGSCLASYAIFTLITILGILLFFFSARKYKARVRDRALRYYM